MAMGPQDDLLSCVLSAYQLRAGIYGNPSLCGAWQLGMYGHRRAAFHFVGRGHCWLHTRERAPEPLQGGDLVVFPHDAWHMLSGESELHGEDNRMIASDGSSPFTTLVCGYFEFLLGEQNPVLDALPDIIIVRREDADRHLGTLGQLLVAEAQMEGLGTRTVLDKLADTLFVMVVRHYVSRVAPAEKKGVLAALADGRLGRALSAMHREPAKAWTLDGLAQMAAMSRAAFARRFAERVGLTPIEYLTRWRMTQAELLLRHPQVSVADTAGKVGYDTEAAFRKAFKRIHGVGPGALRRWFRANLARKAPAPAPPTR